MKSVTTSTTTAVSRLIFVVLLSEHMHLIALAHPFFDGAFLQLAHKQLDILHIHVLQKQSAIFNKPRATILQPLEGVVTQNFLSSVNNLLFMSTETRLYG